jgi:hypothetical protein
VNSTVKSKGKKQTVKLDPADCARYVKGHFLTLLYPQGHAYARVDRTRLLHRVIKSGMAWSGTLAWSYTIRTATGLITDAATWK